MGRPGPAPLPTHLKLLKGTRPDRVNKAEPKPKQQKPKAPSWLADDAKAIWRRTARQLDAMGLLYASDEDILTAYANAVATYQRATKLVDETGLLVEGRRDGMVTNPAVRIQRDAASLIRQLAGELGLTPSARSRLSIEETADDDGSDLLD